MPPRDRQEDQEESDLDSAESTWWAKQLGRDPRRSQLSDALLEADEAAAEDERERTETLDLPPPDKNRKYEGGNRSSAVADSVEQQMRIAEQRIREATARLAEATTQLEQSEEQLVEVEQQRHTLVGEAAVNRHAIAEFQKLLEKSRQELASLHVQEAVQTLDKAVKARDLAVREATSALSWIKTALQQLDERRAAVEQAENELRAVDPEARISVVSETELLDAAWDAVIPLLRARLEERLEFDMVEAAVASQRATAIDELPHHLRELARQRRNQRTREALTRQHSDKQP